MQQKAMKFRAALSNFPARRTMLTPTQRNPVPLTDACKASSPDYANKKQVLNLQAGSYFLCGLQT